MEMIKVLKSEKEVNEWLKDNHKDYELIKLFPLMGNGTIIFVVFYKD